MNTDLILRVADAIEHGSVAGMTYDQNEFGAECGTTSCIAGWTYAVAHGVDRLPQYIIEGYWYNSDHVYVQAQKLLGLSSDQACELMLHESYDRQNWHSDENGDPAPITPAEAAATLRNLAATGVVAWVEHDVDGH